MQICFAGPLPTEIIRIAKSQCASLILEGLWEQSLTGLTLWNLRQSWE